MPLADGASWNCVRSRTALTHSPFGGPGDRREAIRNHQGINLPGVRVSIPSMTEKDIADLEFGLSQNVDLVALSLREGESAGADAAAFGRRLKRGGKRVPIVAKIEKPEARRTTSTASLS